jgi:predicted dehydrogenase
LGFWKKKDESTCGQGIGLDILKVGITGCGAITEIAHLPALTKHPMAEIFGIVDRNEARARSLAKKFAISRYFADYEDLYEHVDAVIIALPNNLHAKTTIDFLKKNINVLCEKPMATTVNDCISMMKAEKDSESMMMIGHNRRFMSNVMFAKKIIEIGALGTIESYECKVGSIFKWPAQTDFYFKKSRAGGGVLIDMGVHIIDLTLWFFGDVSGHLGYQAEDVMKRGVEDNATLDMIHNDSIRGSITLSRTEKLENTMKIKGTDGHLKFGIFDTTLFHLSSRIAKVSSHVDLVDVNTKRNDPFRDQFTHFVHCIRSGKKSLVSGEEGSKVIEIVERCYGKG